MIGNFLGDFYKGSNFEGLPKAVADGVRLHREIDWFTDNHPLVKESLLPLRNEIGRYAGVALDVYFDHLLALSWNSWSEIQLSEYVQRIYSVLREGRSYLNERGNKTFYYMSLHDWLSTYREWEGMHRALVGLSRRTKFESNLEFASKSLKKNSMILENKFFSFYPILNNFCKDFLLEEGYLINEKYPLKVPDSNSSK